MKKHEYVDEQKNGTSSIGSKRKKIKRAKRRSSKRLRQKNQEILTEQKNGA
jgi:hypothetical protein